LISKVDFGWRSSQAPATRASPVILTPRLFKICFNISSHMRQGLPSRHFSSDFPTKIMLPVHFFLFQAW
jgi:hypothetical protein